MDSGLALLIVILLVAANGFFVAAEFALVGARRTRIAQLAQEGSGAAKATQRAQENIDKYIAATQLAITSLNLALGAVGQPAIVPLFDRLFRSLDVPPDVKAFLVNSLAFFLAFVIMTAVQIIFGELTPKAIALQRPEGTALIVARPVTWFAAVFNPAIWVLNRIASAVIRLLGMKPSSESNNNAALSTDELEMLVKSSREAGVLEQSEEEMLRRVFDFSDVTVRQIMRPRTEVDALPLNASLPDQLKIIAENQHSRYPVYDGKIDAVVGILHTKDLLDEIIRKPNLLTNRDLKFKLSSILRTPLFVPEAVSVDALLSRMQRTQTQFAVVVDEYGGMAGVATMEDVIEQIVGEVRDEFDAERNPIQLFGGSTVVDGLLSLDEVAGRFGSISGKFFSTTIGGYISEKLDRIPIKGDTTTYGEYDLIVDEMEGMRVSRIRFTRRDKGVESHSGTENATPSGAVA